METPILWVKQVMHIYLIFNFSKNQFNQNGHYFTYV